MLRPRLMVSLDILKLLVPRTNDFSMFSNPAVDAMPSYLALKRKYERYPVHGT
jgi:hypothetical protein